jgi:predicted RNA binding protein with dsRBD fold (UPF0201 family)
VAATAAQHLGLLTSNFADLAQLQQRIADSVSPDLNEGQRTDLVELVVDLQAAASGLGSEESSAEEQAALSWLSTWCAATLNKVLGA